MIIILNPGAGGGTALRKLNEVEDAIRRRCGEFTVEAVETPEQLGPLVRSRYDGGERHFVAAGGDGCVNALLQAVMTSLTDNQRGSVSIGAVGLGSSNDFHKPLSPDRLISGIPCTMDFSSARPRDVGVLTYPSHGTSERRYFLINASAGLTAEANRFFNSPDRILALLKRISTGAAILYAAFTTMATYQNRCLTIETNGGLRRELELTNLAILKNPNVSGGLKFPGEPRYDSGTLEFHLAGSLRTIGRIRLFTCLAAGRPARGPNMRSWESPAATLSATRPIAVEFDGEVIMTEQVRLSILPRHLQVCTC
jgi:diacylglycerol kinase (ATP)